MDNLAIIIASSEYQNENNNLPIIKNDFRLIANILNLSNKYTEVLAILDNKNAFEVKSMIYSFINKYRDKEINEILFYFSGHGIRKTTKDKDELFLMLYNSVDDGVLSTALSNTEIDTFLKLCKPNLAVKILDYCNANKYNSKESSHYFYNNAEQLKADFNDFIYIFSSRKDDISNSLHDYSFFSKSLALSIIENELDAKIYYKSLISSIKNYSNSTYHSEPIVIMQSAFLHPFIQYNAEIKNFLIEKEKIDPFHFFKTTNENIKVENKDDTFGLLTLKKLILDRSYSYLSKNEIFDYVKKIQDILENGDNYRDISELFYVTFEKGIYINNEDSIGKWLKDNQKKDYFAEPRYEQESYITEEYVSMPKKEQVPQKLFESEQSGMFEKKSFLGQLSAEAQRHQEAEQAVKKVTNYRTVLRGFKLTCSLEPEMSQRLLLSLKPKNSYLCLRAYDIYLVILFSAQEIATFIQIKTLKVYDWDRYTDINSSNWFVKESYFKALPAEEYAQQVISSIRKKLEDSIKEHIGQTRENGRGF